MNKYDFKVEIPYNLNRHTAKLLSKKLSNFNSEIYMSKEDDFRKYNAKSSLGLISLDLIKNDNVNVEIIGTSQDYYSIKNVFEHLPS